MCEIYHITKVGSSFAIELYDILKELHDFHNLIDNPILVN